MQFNAIFEKDEYGYFAYVPALKGCVSQGDNFEEAFKNIREAIELYIEDLDFNELGQAKSKDYIIAPIEVDISHAG
jgi:predicted RNase H-like HicB family nuclease